MLLKVNQDEVVNQSLKNKTMSKYQLENLLNEIAGTGRIGTYIATYRELVNKVDELEEKGIKVKELGMSGDGKTPFEFEIYPGDKDEAFSVYPYKFDPSDGDDMEIHRFSIGGKPVAIRVAKELLGQGAYSNAEIRDGKDELRSTGDKIPAGFEESEKKELPKSIADKEKAEIEKDAKKAKGMMKEEEGFTEVNKEEVRFHLDAYEKGTIDGDDLAKAIEEIVFGDIVAPGMNTDADFEREQRMQMGMREEDSVDENLEEAKGAVSRAKAALARINKERNGEFSDFEIKAYLDSLENDIRLNGEEDYEDFVEDSDWENDIFDYRGNKSLQEHFSRFMKDYQ